MSEKQVVLVLSRNLFFLPRIQAAAAASGYQMRQAATEHEFWEIHTDRDVALVLVDLEGDKNTWTSVVENLSQQEGGVTRVVAYGPHADVAGLELARKLGCDEVLTKGEFSNGLHELIGVPKSAVDE